MIWPFKLCFRPNVVQQLPGQQSVSAHSDQGNEGNENSANEPPAAAPQPVVTQPTADSTTPAAQPAAEGAAPTNADNPTTTQNVDEPYREEIVVEYIT